VGLGIREVVVTGRRRSRGAGRLEARPRRSPLALPPVGAAPHDGAMQCAMVEHARRPPDTGDGSSTRDGGRPLHDGERDRDGDGAPATASGAWRRAAAVHFDDESSV
jgi:hypothetical protein